MEEKLKTDEAYTPLTPEEVAALPPPGAPSMDTYLKARVDKFYAQLAVSLGVGGQVLRTAGGESGRGPGGPGCGGGAACSRPSSASPCSLPARGLPVVPATQSGSRPASPPPPHALPPTKHRPHARPSSALPLVVFIYFFLPSPSRLQDYRPGMLYSDIEVDAAGPRHFSDRVPGRGPPLPPVVPLDDGSFPRSGLGAGGWVAWPGRASRCHQGRLGCMDVAGWRPGGRHASSPGVACVPVLALPACGGHRQAGSPCASQHCHPHTPLGAGTRAAGLGYGRGIRGPPPGLPTPAAAAPGAPGVPLPAAVPVVVGAEGGESDAFSMYRQLRSGSYHTMIMHGAAKKFNA